MEQIGLEGIMKTQAFEKGMGTYLSGLDRMNATTSSVAKQMTTASMAMAVTIGTILANQLQRAATALYNFARGGLDAAMRVQEMDYVLQILGMRVGKTKAELDALTASIVEYGIRTDVSQNLISQFIRYELDLAKATDLARVAQDAAIFTGEDSSQTLQRMIWGIQTYQTEVLRTAGLNVNMQQAFESYAQTLDKTSESLTVNERQQAILNAILVEGTKIAGAYEAAMEAPGKQLRSLGRDVWELSRVLSENLLPAAGTFVTSLRDITKTIKGALDEAPHLADNLRQTGVSAIYASGAYDKASATAGKLHGYLVNLGALSSVLADAFVAMAEKGTNAIIQFLSDSQSKIENFIVNALQWGINVATQFASGIIQGAAGAITAAMNYIASLLTSWLSPGSPPRVAPELPKWGIGAMTEWLEGFTQADFSVLSGIQSPLKSALDLLAQTAQLTPEESGKLYADLSAGIAEALATGEFDQDLLSDIADATGIFGEEIADLAEQYFMLAESELAAEDAQRALLAMQQQAALASQHTNDLVGEYNKMLREGASQKALDAKLAEINAAKDNEEALYGQQAAAEEYLYTLQLQQQAIQEMIQSQAALVQQLLELTRAQIVQPALPVVPAGGGGVGAPEMPEAPAGGLGGGIGTGIADAIEKALEEAKERIRKKLEEMFAPIREIWEREVQPVLAEMGKAWDNFVTVLGQTWDKWGKPVWEGLKKLIPPDLIENMGKIAGVALVVAAAIWLLNVAIGILLSPIVLLAIAVAMLIVAWDLFGEQVKTTLFQAWFITIYYLNLLWEALFGWTGKSREEIQAWFKDIITSFTSWGITAARQWGKSWDDMATISNTRQNNIRIAHIQWGLDIIANITNWGDTARGLFSLYYQLLYAATVKWIADTIAGYIQWGLDIIGWILGVLSAIELMWSGAWQRVKDFVVAIWSGPDGIVTKITTAVDTVKSKLTGPDSLGETIGTFVTTTLANLATGLDTARTAFTNLITKIQDFINKILGSAFARAKDLLDFVLPGSLPPLAKGIYDVAKAMDMMSQSTLPLFTSRFAAASVPMGVMGGTINFNLGGNSFYNQMSEAAFEARVVRIVRRQLNV